MYGKTLRIPEQKVHKVLVEILFNKIALLLKNKAFPFGNSLLKVPEGVIKKLSNFLVRVVL